MRIRSSHIISIIGTLIFIFVLVVVMRDRMQNPESGFLRAGASPQIIIEQESFDLGVAPNDRITVIEVPVSNTGQGTLNIESIQGSCICVRGRIEPLSIPPGGDGILYLEFDPLDWPSFEAKDKTIAIRSNDPARKVAIVYLTALIEPEFEIEPLVFDFGEVKKGETVERTMVLRQLCETPFDLLSLEMAGQAPDGIELSFDQLPQNEWREPDKVEYVIRGRLLPNIRTGELTTMFRIVTSIERMSEGLATLITGRVVASHTITPEGIVGMGDIRPGQERASTIRIAGDRPIQVSDVTLNDDALSATVRETDNPQLVLIDIDVLPHAPKGRIRTDLTFTVDDGTGKVPETLLVYGMVR